MTGRFPQDDLKMKIMVFLHGTAIMHRNAVGRTREERVRQIQNGGASVRDFAFYVPVGHTVSKLQAWKAQGTEIMCLSAHRNVEDIEGGP